MNCPHCNIELELDKKTGALICPKCHCKFRLCLVWFDPKCYAKTYPDIIKALKKEQKKEKKHGKRGRPKKKFTIGPDGEKINVSIDNPKLKKLVDEAEEMIEE